MRELVKELEEKHGWEVDNDFLDNNKEFLEALVEITRTKALKEKVKSGVLADVSDSLQEHEQVIREQIKEVVAYLLNCERTTDNETIEIYTETIMLGADKYAEAKFNDL